MTALGKLFVLFIVASAVSGGHPRLRRLAPLAQLAGEYDFPHQVSIQRDGRHHCGGALISRRHVLTAAHCVRGFILSPEPSYVTGQRLLVEVGSNVIGAGTKHAIQRISQKREYKGDTGDFTPFIPYDIAVITLRTPVTESAKVKIIGLPAASSEIPEGSKVTISGFGSTKMTEPPSNVLKTSPMYITTQDECNDFYTKMHRRYIKEYHICAKYRAGAGTCQGDSGGPLIQGNTVVGVVSGGHDACGKGNPDIYTKVSHYIPYIQYEMNYNPGTPEDWTSPSLAVNVEESTPPVQPLWLHPTQDIQYMDPNTGEILPPDSLVLVDPITGQPIVPVTPNFPHLPLYPIYYIFNK